MVNGSELIRIMTNLMVARKLKAFARCAFVMIIFDYSQFFIRRVAHKQSSSQLFARRGKNESIGKTVVRESVGGGSSGSSTITCQSYDAVVFYLFIEIESFLRFLRQTLIRKLSS